LERKCRFCRSWLDSFPRKCLLDLHFFAMKSTWSLLFPFEPYPV
jgi:hypothetical protein